MLAGAALMALSFQFRLGPELLVTGAAGQRVQALGAVIRDELSSSPRPEWDRILRRFGSGYNVHFALFRNDGSQVAGDNVTAPREVLQRISEGRGLPRRGPPLREDGPPRANPDLPPPPGPVIRAPIQSATTGPVTPSRSATRPCRCRGPQLSRAALIQSFQQSRSSVSRLVEPF